MLPVTGNVNAQPRKISCKLEIGGNTITSVKMLTYNTDWTGNITVGNVVSSYISVTLPTPSFSLAGANVALSMGIGDPAEWVSIGIFRVDEESIQTKQGYTSFNAYDKLYSAINTYHTSLTYPDPPAGIPLQSIYAEVCGQIGLTSYPNLTYNPSFQADSEVLEMLDGYTLRDVLGFIAAYQGKNAYLSPAGALEFRWFTASGYTADGTRANVPYIGENNSTVGRLICQTANGVITTGSGEGIYFTCPFMDSTRLSSMLSSLSLTYRKADVDIPYGNFCLQSGDIITVTTVQNQTLSVPIMNNSWTYDGGLSSTVAAYDVSDYSGTANNAERSLSVRRVQRQMAVNRATSDLKAASEKITGASGGYIRINFGGDGKTAALLIMDTEDISTAQNVWVFNQGGLGHFPNGYDPTAQANVALTYDGWVVAERISGTLISGVGIENVAPGTISRPKIVLADGAIDFQRVAADPDGSISDIGSIKYVPRSAQEEIDSLSIRVQQGKTVTIGYENNGAVSDQFVYYSDLSAPNVPSDAAKFNFWGDLRIFSELHWISLTDLDKRVEQERQAIADIVDSGAKNRVDSTSGSGTNWAHIPVSLPAGTYAVAFGSITSPSNTSGVVQVNLMDGETTVNTQYTTINLSSDPLVCFLTTTAACNRIRLYSENSGGNSIGKSVSYTDAFICKKELWDISPVITPYCPTLAELYDIVKNL